MLRRGLKVTFLPLDPSQIPDLFTQGVAILLRWMPSGVITMLAQTIKMRRQGGYCGLDIFLFLFLYYASGATLGIRAFWEKLRPFKHLIAAVVGRTSLCSPSALSRALRSTSYEEIRAFSHKLLLGLCDCDALLKHPCAASYDAHARPWHVFDLDPTVTALRHRALPERDDLPEARRDSEQTGMPGYPGRKRGDIQFRRTAVQHAGSSLWTHAHLNEVSGDSLRDLGIALDSITSLVDHLEHPRSRTLVRLDGEFGHVPGFHACRDRHLPFVTRLRRPSLYKDPAVLHALRTATFCPVSDSLSGPRRCAADVGILTLEPTTQRLRADDSPYEPIEVRVVACIYPREGKAQRGKVIDGWQVEFFATDTSPEDWSASDVVTEYFSRAGQENRFAQEDREHGLDRIVSYHLPGQEMASVVALSLWNYRVVEGFLMECPETIQPEPHPRQESPDERVPVEWPRDPVLTQLLDTLDWSDLLARKSGWSWDATRGELRCEDGRLLTLTTVRTEDRTPERSQMIFRRPKGGCQECEYRPGCLRSKDPETPKHAEFSIPAKTGEKLWKRLAKLRDRDAPSIVEEIEVPAGPYEVSQSLFLPSVARQHFVRLFERGRFRIELRAPEKRKRHLRLIAENVAERQRRRKSWAENVARYALDARAEMNVELSSSDDLVAWLSEAAAEPALARAG